MEIDSLTCQTELLRGQLGNIVRMFINPRQDKLANLLPSGVSWRSHRLRPLLPSPYRGSHQHIVKGMFIIVKFIMGIVRCSCLRRLSVLSRLIIELAKSIFANVKPFPRAPFDISATRCCRRGIILTHRRHRREMRSCNLLKKQDLADEPISRILSAA